MGEYLGERIVKPREENTESNYFTRKPSLEETESAKRKIRSPSHIYSSFSRTKSLVIHISLSLGQKSMLYIFG